jgi:hypothetical protein
MVGTEEGAGDTNLWASAIVTGGNVEILIQIQIDSNRFKFYQSLTAPKRTFPSYKILK